MTTERARRHIVIDRVDVAPDTGCEVSPSCLTCPLPQCKYDDPQWYRTYLYQGRDEQIMAYRGEGHSIQEACSRFSVSPRTVARARTRR